MVQPLERSEGSTNQLNEYAKLGRKAAYRHTGFNNPNFLLFTLLADFLYLSLDGVFLHLMCA